MPALPRKTQLIFGQSLVPNGNVAKFGSLAGGAAAYSSDPALIQTPQWLLGLAGALVGNRSPALEDLNGLFLVLTQQLAYLLQSGVPEWDTNTPYWNGQLARIPGTNVVASSRTDNNQGNNPTTDSNNWDTTALSSGVQAITIGTQSVAMDSTAHLVNFASIGWNPRGYWNPATGVFTAPVKGMYDIKAALQIDNVSTSMVGIDGFLRVTNTGGGGYLWAQGWGNDNPPGSRWYPSLNGAVPLNAGDQISIYLGGVGGGGGNVNVSNSFLSICRQP